MSRERSLPYRGSARRVCPVEVLGDGSHARPPCTNYRVLHVWRHTIKTSNIRRPPRCTRTGRTRPCWARCQTPRLSRAGLCARVLTMHTRDGRQQRCCPRTLQRRLRDSRVRLFARNYFQRSTNAARAVAPSQSPDQSAREWPSRALVSSAGRVDAPRRQHHTSAIRTRRAPSLSSRSLPRGMRVHRDRASCMSRCRPSC